MVGAVSSARALQKRVASASITEAMVNPLACVWTSLNNIKVPNWFLQVSKFEQCAHGKQRTLANHYWALAADRGAGLVPVCRVHAFNPLGEVLTVLSTEGRCAGQVMLKLRD